MKYLFSKYFDVDLIIWEKKYKNTKDIEIPPKNSKLNKYSIKPLKSFTSFRKYHNKKSGNDESIVGKNLAIMVYVSNFFVISLLTNFKIPSTTIFQ